MSLFDWIANLVLVAWLIFLVGDGGWIDLGLAFLALVVMNPQVTARRDERTEDALPKKTRYLLVFILFAMSIIVFRSGFLRDF